MMSNIRLREIPSRLTLESHTYPMDTGEYYGELLSRSHLLILFTSESRSQVDRSVIICVLFFSLANKQLEYAVSPV